MFTKLYTNLIRITTTISKEDKEPYSFGDIPLDQKAMGPAGSKSKLNKDNGQKAPLVAVIADIEDGMDYLQLAKKHVEVHAKYHKWFMEAIELHRPKYTYSLFKDEDIK